MSLGQYASAPGSYSAAKSVDPPATLGDPPITHSKFFQVLIPAVELTLGFFTQITGFSSQVDVQEYPEGGVNTFVHKLPGRIKQGNITLKRGITKESALVTWYEKSVTALEPTELTIHVLDYEGNIVTTWTFDGAYPVKWSGTDLNAGGSEFLTQSLEIAHLGMKVV